MGAAALTTVLAAPAFGQMSISMTGQDEPLIEGSERGLTVSLNNGHAADQEMRLEMSAGSEIALHHGDDVVQGEPLVIEGLTVAGSDLTEVDISATAEDVPEAGNTAVRSCLYNDATAPVVCTAAIIPVEESAEVESPWTIVWIGLVAVALASVGGFVAWRKSRVLDDEVADEA